MPITLDWSKAKAASQAMGQDLQAGKPVSQAGKNPQQSEIDKLKGFIQEGEAKAAETFKPGVMGRMKDPRQAEMNAALAKLEAGQQGLTPEEMRVLREQGETEINRQLATNMQKLGGVAAAHGIRGGAGAGLQGQAISQAQQQAGDLARQLAIQNIEQRNIGTDRYLGALTGQQGTELGIQGENLAAKRQELLGRTSMPFQYASMLSGASAADTANKFQNQQMQLARDYLDKANQPAAAAPSEAPASSATTGFTKKASDLGQIVHKPEEVEASHKNQEGDITTVNIGGTGYVSEEQLPQGTNIHDYKEVYVDPKTGKKYFNPNTPMTENAKKAASNKIICTESARQKILPKKLLLVSYSYGKLFLSKDELQAYHTWGRPVVKLMKWSPRFTRLISKLLPPLISAEGELLGHKNAKSTAFGRFLLWGFHKLNSWFMPKKKGA